jgi:hypothetical protein
MYIYSQLFHTTADQRYCLMLLIVAPAAAAATTVLLFVAGAYNSCVHETLQRHYH